MLKLIIFGCIFMLPLVSSNSISDERQVIELWETGPATCLLCTDVMKAAQYLLEQNKTEDEVVAFIEKDLCGFLGSLNATCVQYIEAYGKMLLYYLGQQVNPAVICHDTLHLCMSIEMKTKSFKCNMCQFIVQNAENLLNKDKIEAQIVKALERLCMLAPGTNLKNECKSIVDLYSVYLIKLIAELDSNKTCQEMKLC